MAYNHGKAEYKWKLWKEREEKILRDSGVTEDTIEAIRFYDRQAFNSDRRYYERVQETDTYLDTVAASTDQAEPKTVQDFLDYIENQELFHVLITVDRLKEKVQNDVWIAVFMQLFLVALDKTKEVNNYKISYQAGGLKSDGGMGLVRKKAEICSDCNMDFEDFMRNKPVAGRDINDR